MLTKTDMFCVIEKMFLKQAPVALQYGLWDMQCGRIRVGKGAWEPAHEGSIVF